MTIDDDPDDDGTFDFVDPSDGADWIDFQAADARFRGFNPVPEGLDIGGEG